MVINGRPREVRAVFAKLSTRGVLVFTDGQGNAVKAFAADTWSSVESLEDPFGNPIVHMLDDDVRDQGPRS